MVALVDGVPRTLEPQGADRALRQPPARGRHPPHPVRAAPGRGPRPHPRGAADRARQPRRRDRADPRLGRHRCGEGRPDRALRALRGAGAGDPRHAPRPPHRAGVRQAARGARGTGQADRRAARDPRRPGPDRRGDRRGAGRGRPALRRRAAHRSHPLRGRHEHRGHDRRPADGDLDHPLRLRQAPAARDLSPAASWRPRGDGDGPQGGRLHRAPAHLLDPRLPALLHQPRQGLPAQGLRAAGGLADLERPRPGQRPAASRRREGDRGDPDPRLQREQATSSSPPPRAWSRRPSSRPTTRRSAPTGSSRSRSATATSWSRSASPRATTTSCSSPSRVTPRASPRRPCGRWGATPAASRA